jgi:hypothetical protein
MSTRGGCLPIPRKAREPDVEVRLFLPAPLYRLIKGAAARRAGLRPQDAMVKTLAWVFYKGAPSKGLDSNIDPHTAGLNGLRNAQRAESAEQCSAEV